MDKYSKTPTSPENDDEVRCIETDFFARFLYRMITALPERQIRVTARAADIKYEITIDSPMLLSQAELDEFYKLRRVATK